MFAPVAAAHASARSIVSTSFGFAASIPLQRSANAPSTWSALNTLKYFNIAKLDFSPVDLSCFSIFEKKTTMLDFSPLRTEHPAACHCLKDAHAEDWNGVKLSKTVFIPR